MEQITAITIFFYLVLGFFAVSILFLLIVKYYRIICIYQKLSNAINKFNEEDSMEGFRSEAWNDWPQFQAALKKAEEKIDVNSVNVLKNKQAEYLALQNQINPHFLYNTLEAIRGDAICEGMHNIADTTKALATFFRYTITEVGYLVTLEDELENIENYFTIQQYRFGEKLDMKINFPEDHLELMQVQLPKLTLQPLIENAISHGLECKVGVGTITIDIDYTKETLTIHVRDDGVGIEEEELLRLNQMFLRQDKNPMSEERSQRGSIALGNVNSRIKLLFGEDYGIHINSILGMGTQVEVRLPLIIEKE